MKKIWKSYETQVKKEGKGKENEQGGTRIFMVKDMLKERTTIILEIFGLRYFLFSLPTKKIRLVEALFFLSQGQLSSVLGH